VSTSHAFEYALRLGDDALILAQRLGEWAAKAPELEEDVALTNIGLDLLGQARALLTYAGEVEGRARSRTEDDLAFLRDEREFVNCQLVELPNGDFADTMARQLVFSSYSYELYEALQTSSDETLAAIAAKSLKEVAYHRDHATQWTLRLGDGTEHSHARMQAAIERVWPYVGELFTDDEVSQAFVPNASLREGFDRYVLGVLAEATLTVPETTWAPGGGRSGIHTEHFGYLLAEMQHLHRSHPGASW
jgi:ring-1,2-phenylacetyl-CoA epoxidase subunit PaaC